MCTKLKASVPKSMARLLKMNLFKQMILSVNVHIPVNLYIKNLILVILHSEVV